MRKRNRHKIIIGIEVMILSITVSLLGTNAASANPPSNGVSYNKNGQVTVQNALDDLYNKANYGNATASQILKGRTALVGGKQVTGTYEALSLSSQTPGDATAENIDKGKIAWVNGEKIVGTGESMASFLRLGDYISYTPSTTSYAIFSSDTGVGKDQKIYPSELNVWRVIRKNEDGTIELVSENTSSTIVNISGVDDKIGYKNYIGILNKIAHAYETEGLTVGSRHMGYDGTAPEYLTEIGNNKDEGYKVDVALVKTAIGKLDAMGVSSDSYDVQSYWLASRDYNFSNSISKGNCVNKYGNPVSVDMYTSSGYGSRIRPIVVLAANLKLVGGDGSVNTPFVLGK